MICIRPIYASPPQRAYLRQLTDQLYRFAWDREGRKGQLCRVYAWGSLNSCLVKFGDGFTMVTSRNALRKHAEPAHKDRSGSRAASA